MIKQVDLTNALHAEELYNMQKSSYLIEANLIGFYEIPPLKESFLEFLDCNETFIGYYEGTQLAGALSYTIEEEKLTICRMFVHPQHFRKGIARKLLIFIEEKNPDILTYHVSTGKDNLPAKVLYLETGFQFVLDYEVVPGLFISCFIKEKQHQTHV